MSPHTPTLPPTDGAMWRKLLAKVHPDAGGDHELFVWAYALREMVCAGVQERHERQDEPPPEASERIPYPDGVPDAFEAASSEAMRLAAELGTENVYGALLAVLTECKPSEAYAYREERGATYRQLAAIAHTVGMSKAERVRWYRLAESVPLSDAHAAHILGRLKEQAA